MTKAITPFALAAIALSCTPLLAQAQEKSAAEAAADAVVEAAMDAAEAAARSANHGEKDDSRSEWAYPPQPRDWDAIMARPIDYPPSAWAADQTGETSFTLTIDATGKPTDCTITASSGFAVLDEKSCEIAMERGVFTPAMDTEGNPIIGKFEGNHSWYKRDPEFPGTATIHVKFTVTETGEVLNCETVEMSGVMSERTKRSFEREPCPGSRRGARALYRDENGNPIAKDVSLKVEVIITDPE